MENIDIKAIRKRLNSTQEEFAKKLGVRFETVNRWENGKTKPSPLAMEKIKRLAKKVSKMGVEK